MSDASKHLAKTPTIDQVLDLCVRLWRERLEAEKRAQQAEAELTKLRAELETKRAA